MTCTSRAHWRTVAAGGLFTLGLLADVHVIAAYAILAFVIAHVYLLTTGHSFVAHVRPMVTGWDEDELTEAEEAYLAETKAVPMR